jgi:anti-sigma B factor antagonist
MRILRRAGRADAWSVDVETADGPGAVVIAEGELDLSAVPELRGALERAAALGGGRVLLDLGEVSFLDSLSLAAIVAAKRRMSEGGRLAVVVRHPYVRLIFEAGGLDGVVALFGSRAEAEAYLRA